MRRRHKKKRTTDKVELNLAAMLDMAFQLLTFFILTFRPAPVEGQLAVNLPPPVALTQPTESTTSTSDTGTEAEDRETLPMFVTSNDRGTASEVRVGGFIVAKGSLDQFQLKEVDKRLKTLFNASEKPFDHVQIAVDGRLHYDELMKLIDICTKQTLPDGKPLQKISFTEMPRGAEAP